MVSVAQKWLRGFSCAIIILLEGFDIQADGVSAPGLTLAFNLSSRGKGIFPGASAVGIFISALLGGFLAVFGFLVLDFRAALLVAFGVGAFKGLCILKVLQSIAPILSYQ